MGALRGGKNPEDGRAKLYPRGAQVQGFGVAKNPADGCLTRLQTKVARGNGLPSAGGSIITRLVSEAGSLQ